MTHLSSAKRFGRVVLKRIWTEMRVGILIAASVLAFIALGYLLSYGLYMAGLASVENRDRLLHPFMTVGIAVLIVSLTVLIVRDGYRKARAARRSLSSLGEKMEPGVGRLIRQGHRIRPGTRRFP